jgi:hypothetical protein
MMGGGGMANIPGMPKDAGGMASMMEMAQKMMGGGGMPN